MDTLEAVDSISDSEVNEEHGSFIFEGPQDTYSFDETPSPLAISTHTESNHPVPLHQKKFERVVVDEFVYHKYCKSQSGFCHKSCSENDNGPSCTDDEREATSPRFAAT